MVLMLFLPIILHVEPAVFKIKRPVGLGDLTNHPTGVTDGDYPRRNVFRNDAARADYAARADGHPRQDHGVAADSDAVADGNGNAVFIAGVTAVRMNRVSGGID